VWAGHDTPTILGLALFGSFVSYIYSAPPLKVPAWACVGMVPYAGTACNSDQRLSLSAQPPVSSLLTRDRSYPPPPPRPTPTHPPAEAERLDRQLRPWLLLHLPALVVRAGHVRHPQPARGGAHRALQVGGPSVWLVCLSVRAVCLSLRRLGFTEGTYKLPCPLLTHPPPP
jgi:hypothetical protein